VVDLPEIASWCISEAGEGKDQVDSNASIYKQGLNRKRNEGRDQEDAAQYAEQLRELGLTGNSVVEKQVLNSKFTPQKHSSVGDIRGKFLTVVDPTNESLIIYEFLDYKRSLLSLEDGGLVKGYGSGEVISFKKFDINNRSRSSKLGVKIIANDGKLSNPKQFITPALRVREAARKKAKKDEADIKRKDIMRVKKLRLSSCDNNLTYPCNKCGVELSTAASLLRHQSRTPGCTDKKMRAEERKRNLDVKERVIVIEKENITKHDKFKANLNTTTVSLTPLFNIHSIGIMLKVVNERLMVIKISGLAFLSGLIHIGFILEEINGRAPPLDVTCLDADIAGSSVKQRVLLKFRRPDAELPLHGAYRKLIQKKPRLKPQPRQLDFFNNAFKKNPLISSLDLHNAMKVEFGYELRDDLMPLYFTKSYISNLIKDKKMEAKKARQNNIPEAKVKVKTDIKIDEKNDEDIESDDDDEKPLGGFESDSDAALSSGDESLIEVEEGGEDCRQADW
jgi:hypothetical protein